MGTDRSERTRPCNIVIGQRVVEEKVQVAKNLRRNMTEHEKTLWKHLRTNRLGGFHFRRQQVIHGFIVDFYCHKAGLVVEVDGDIHLTAKEYDSERDALLRGLGLTIVRISNSEIETNIEKVLDRIFDLCRRT